MLDADHVYYRRVRPAVRIVLVVLSVAALIAAMHPGSEGDLQAPLAILAGVCAIAALVFSREP